MKKNIKETKKPKTQTEQKIIKTLNFPLPPEEFQEFVDTKIQQAKEVINDLESNSNVIKVDFKNKKRLA